MALELACNNEEKIEVTLTPVTTTGKPARVDGIPVWAVVSGPGTIVPAADGMSAFVISQDTISTNPSENQTVYSVLADADTGDGVVEIGDNVILQVEGARAANLGLKAGPAVPK